MFTPGRPKGRRGSFFTLSASIFVHVEGRIGHHKVGLADQLVRVFVVGYGLLDVALQAVDGQVHLGQADGGGVLFQAVEGELLGGVGVQALHEMRTLHEHAAGAAGRVEHDAACRFDDVGDQRDQGDRGKELAVVVGLQVGELGQEVFVDAAEDVPGGRVSAHRG